MQLLLAPLHKALPPLGIGLSSGVIMASGDVQQAAGNGASFASTVVGSAGGPLSSNSSWGDFQRCNHTAIRLCSERGLLWQFQYVFWFRRISRMGPVSSFNDMFAFTIQGVTVPMPQTNIALIPGTAIPVVHKYG